MSKVSWRDRMAEWFCLYGPLFLTLFVMFGGLASLLIATADVPGLSGTVGDVTVIHGEDPYSIVTIEGEEYRYDGDVAPQEGDEIVFTEKGAFTFGLPIMTEWHLAD